jgi:undecaprenyl phosphate N,N'-diacetylbacillosamine 1-phosphate transferase
MRLRESRRGHWKGANNIYDSYLKRAFDVAVVLLMGIALGPLIALAMLAIKLDSPGPVLFRQSRLGRNGATFEIIKLRTMYHRERAADHEIYPGDPELTRVGTILRRLKIDEMPQFWHVLLGDMSLVGPRPCLPELATSFDENGWARLRARPGMTGLAQTSGNVHLSWRERWRLDAEYVNRLSFGLDLKILIKTLCVLALGEVWFRKS